MSVNRQWLLARRPQGMVTPEDFELREEPVPEPGDGEFLVRNLYLSLDPAMRGWMTDAPSYIPPVGLGEVMRGATIGRVEASNHPEYSAGDRVVGTFGWQDYAVSGATGPMPPTKVPEGVPDTMPIGVLGMTSLTAYFGLKDIGQPKEGDVVVISGAAGATGSVAGQIARLWGCHVIGIAGGPDKCAWLVDDLGFDAAIDYRGEKVHRRLRELCPKGLDIYWDNVGGDILEAALSNLARHARVIICGAIATYNADSPPPGPRNYMQLLIKRSRMEGFLVFDYLHRTDEAMADLVPWVMNGEIKYREDVREGLETAPETLVELYTGGNTGKLLVHISD